MVDPLCVIIQHLSIQVCAMMSQLLKNVGDHREGVEGVIGVPNNWPEVIIIIIIIII